MKQLKAACSLMQRSNQTNFSDIGIKSIIASILEKNFQITQPTLSQKAFIPAILSGSDIYIRDVTGSGKTFGLALSSVAYPRFASYRHDRTSHSTDSLDSAESSNLKVILGQEMIHDMEILEQSTIQTERVKKSPNVLNIGKMPQKNDRYIHTLIIVPNRDLAIQISDWIKGLSSSLIHGDEMRSMVQCIISGPEVDSQSQLLSQFTPRIVVGTPNRLMELYDKKTLDLSRLKLMIIDEADRIVSSVSRYAPVKKRFNVKVHKLDGEILIDRLFKDHKAKGNSYHLNLVDQSKIQVVACSASMTSALRSVFTRNRWIVDPIHVDTTGKILLPNTLDHSAYIVQADGLYSFDWTSQDEEITDITTLDQNSEMAQIDTQKEKGNSSVSDELVNKENSEQSTDIAQIKQKKCEINPTLADDDPLIIESVKYLIDKGNFSSGFIFTHSSVSIRKVVENLKAVGLDAARFIDFRNYQEQSQGREIVPISSFPKWIVLTEHEARGLDLPHAKTVFILGLASSTHSYLHMAGRVGRSGNPGNVISILGGSIYESRFRSIASLLKFSPSQNKIE